LNASMDLGRTDTEMLDSDGLKLFDLSRVFPDDLRMSLDPSSVNGETASLVEQISRERDELTHKLKVVHLEHMNQTLE